MEEKILPKKRYKTRSKKVFRFKIHYFYAEVRPDPFGLLRTICNVRKGIDHNVYLKNIRLRNTGIYKDVPPDICKLCEGRMKKDYPDFQGINHGMEQFEP